MRIKKFGQIPHIREPARKADLKNALNGRLHEMTGVLEAPLAQILLKGQPKHILEEMRQIRQREMLSPRDLPKQQLALIVSLNSFPRPRVCARNA